MAMIPTGDNGSLRTVIEATTTQRRQLIRKEGRSPILLPFDGKVPMCVHFFKMANISIPVGAPIMQCLYI